MAEQGVNVKDRVFGAADSTKNNVIEKSGDVKDKVVGAADNTKTNATGQGGNIKDKVVGATDNTKNNATIKDKVVGAVDCMLEATKTGVVQCVDKAQNYLKPTSATTDPASPAPTENKKQ